MKMKSTKRALLMSALSLLLCCSMLIGTTFAWFTDEVKSANNIIKSGNLDIELEYWNGTKWVDVKGASDILTNTLWEPGVTEVAYLRVANAGTLALKYQLGVNIVSEKPGFSVENKEFKLSDYIQFGVVKIAEDAEHFAPYAKDASGRAQAIVDANKDDAESKADKISAGYTKASSMTAGQELYLALVVYMPTTVGNEANHNGVDIPSIDLGVGVFATIVVGRNAYGTTKIDGGGLELITHSKAEIGGPLNQFSTVGWKATKAAEILVDQYMVKIYSSASQLPGASN